MASVPNSPSPDVVSAQFCCECLLEPSNVKLINRQSYVLLHNKRILHKTRTIKYNMTRQVAEEKLTTMIKPDQLPV